jgi:hypothetical protein
MDDQHLREHLRRLVIGYAVLGSVLNAYLTTAISMLMDRVESYQALMALGLFIGAVVVIYAPFIKTLGLPANQWIVRIKQLFVVVGMLIMAFEAFFVSHGVYGPTFSGSVMFVCSLLFGIPGNVRFSEKRLDAL